MSVTESPDTTTNATNATSTTDELAAPLPTLPPPAPPSAVAVHAAMAGSAARSDRLVGKVMLVIGVVSMIVGAAGAIVGGMLIGSMRHSVDDSLSLTGDTLDTASDSIALSASIVDTLRLSITSVSDALTAVQTSVDDTSGTIGDVGAFLTGPMSDTIQSVSDVFPTLHATANTIDDALSLLSRVPFGPDYQPDVPFGDTIGNLGDAISPLPDQLATLNTDFTALQTSADDVSTRLATVIDDVSALTDRLDSIDDLLARYADTAARAKLLAASSRGDLDRNASLGIMLAVLIGMLAVGSQIVPLWLGRRLSQGRFAWPVAPPPTPAVEGLPPEGAGGVVPSAVSNVVSNVEVVDVVGPTPVAPVNEPSTPTLDT